MVYRTREQVYAERAYGAVKKRKAEEAWEGYSSFAKSFPALVQSCGLAQALSFAEAKKMEPFISDLETVIRGHVSGEAPLPEESRTASLESYMLLTRQVMSAAGWIKRYVDVPFD